MKKEVYMERENYYIAYGSNTNVRQMALRCPNAEAVGTGVIENYRLTFKTLYSSAFATVEPCEGETVPVVVWTISRRDEASLDRYEGVPTHYTKERLEVIMNGKAVSSLVYVMNPRAVPQLPSKGYFDVVLSGYHSFGLNEQILYDVWHRIENEDTLIHNTLQHYRQMKGMTQVQLADAAQISVKTLQKYERGERNIQNAHSNTVLKLAQVLDVSPYLLLR